MPIGTSSPLEIDNANTGLVQQVRLVCGPRGCVRTWGPRRAFAFAPGRFHRDWRWRHRHPGWWWRSRFGDPLARVRFRGV